MKNSILIENLSKKYRLGVIGYGTLRQDLQSWWAKIQGKEDPNSGVSLFADQQRQSAGNLFWALRNININIKQGEILGIIGKNGAGKSTLLKILSRVTAPSNGIIKIKGRVASLLEVGTGFHPELTGLENIFMNGAILGMTREEIKSKLDEIIEFSGVSEFIETPVKRYSSGMHVRLAFAVAAHLESEILIVDEVLAVGDVEFQRKCLGKMNQVAGQGRTILFVSHNLNSVQQLCTRSILLENGTIKLEGRVEDVIESYISTNINKNEIRLKDRSDREGSGRFRFESIQAISLNNEKKQIISSGEPILFRIQYSTRQPILLSNIKISIIFKDLNNNTLFSCPIHVKEILNDVTLDKTGILGCKLKKIPLPTGVYKIDLFSAIGKEITDWVKEAKLLDIAPGDFYGTGKNPYHGGRGVLVDFEWDY